MHHGVRYIDMTPPEICGLSILFQIGLYNSSLYEDIYIMCVITAVGSKSSEVCSSRARFDWDMVHTGRSRYQKSCGHQPKIERCLQWSILSLAGVDKAHWNAVHWRDPQGLTCTVSSGGGAVNSASCEADSCRLRPRLCDPLLCAA